MKTFLLFASSVLGQKTEWFRRCVKPTNLDLDATRYLGTWWEQANYLPSFGDKSYSCIKAQYSNFDGDSIAVNNSYVRPEGDDQVFAWGTGTGEITNPETPNSLLVTFDSTPAIGLWFIKLFGNNYHVMETDYENYAIVMSCTNYGFFRSTFFWILSRNPNFRNTASFDEVLNSAVDNYQIKSDSLHYVNTVDCDFDRIADENL